MQEAEKGISIRYELQKTFTKGTSVFLTLFKTKNLQQWIFDYKGVPKNFNIYTLSLQKKLF